MTIPPAFTALVETFSVLPQQAGRVAAFTTVRDMAYGDIGSRNPFDVLEKKKGTCSGKHALLRFILIELGYEVQAFFALHDFSTFPIAQWPAELEKYRTMTLTDYHDFLKVKIGDAWVTIDAIFDAQMKQWGFPVADWDGESDMALPVQAQEIFEAEEDVEEHKKRLIAALPEQVQKDRKEFLHALTNFLDRMRDAERLRTWLNHAKGYLEAPRLCCQELLSPHRNRGEDDPELPEGWIMRYYVDSFLPVILYGTKHGIEVMLKTLLLRLKCENEMHHDIKKLFGDLRERVLQVPWKVLSEHHLTDVEISKAKASLSDLESLINYFADNLFIDEKLKTGPILDPKNELFKYPEMKKQESIFSYEELVRLVDEDDVKELQKKIALIQRYLLNIGYLISVETRWCPEVFMK